MMTAPEPSRQPMAAAVVAATGAGVAFLDGRRALPSLDVVAVAPASGGGWWVAGAEAGSWNLLHLDPDSSATVHAGPGGIPLTSVLEADGEVLVGASEARLLRLVGHDLDEDLAFASAPGRERWHTPWGGPPDVRTLARHDDGTVYVNVHVGGILRRDPSGWEPTIDIAADVHQVADVPGRPGWVAAACARGLALSRDRGATWSYHTDGLHASYSRAVAVAGDHLLLSCSTGPGGRRSALYRSPLEEIRFERCRQGLPEWFTDNVDSGCVVAAGDRVLAADPDGTVYGSGDGGATWETVARGLPPIRALAAA